MEPEEDPRCNHDAWFFFDVLPRHVFILIDPFVVSGPRRWLDACMITSLGSVLAPRSASVSRDGLLRTGRKSFYCVFTRNNVCVGASWDKGRWHTYECEWHIAASDGVAHLVGLDACE